jgi:nitrate/TMAO reductase-like tetraheme cytochrome c subunit
MSCHEMRDNVGKEWKQSAHYKNASGVRAVCADCHVPKDWTAKLWRKIQATNELYHHFTGTIDTPEKFDAKRAELAERVWATMKASDSRECRNCHTYEAMDFHKQSRRAQEKMREGIEEGKTCIECHTGVAHKRPPEDD